MTKKTIVRAKVDVDTYREIQRALVDLEPTAMILNDPTQMASFVQEQQELIQKLLGCVQRDFDIPENENENPR